MRGGRLVKGRDVRKEEHGLLGDTHTLPASLVFAITVKHLERCSDKRKDVGAVTLGERLHSGLPEHGRKGLKRRTSGLFVSQNINDGNFHSAGRCDMSVVMLKNGLISFCTH